MGERYICPKCKALSAYREFACGEGTSMLCEICGHDYILEEDLDIYRYL